MELLLLALCLSHISEVIVILSMVQHMSLQSMNGNRCPAGLSRKSLNVAAAGCPDHTFAVGRGWMARGVATAGGGLQVTAPALMAVKGFSGQAC